LSKEEEICIPISGARKSKSISKIYGTSGTSKRSNAYSDKIGTIPERKSQKRLAIPKKLSILLLPLASGAKNRECSRSV
jgi:hypothetical protein